MEHVKSLTHSLLQELSKCEERFLTLEKPEKSKELFNHLRTFIDPVFKMIDLWEAQSMLIIEKEKLKVHPQQIQSTKENMEQVILHSYYLDVRKRRFMEMVKSCEFVFKQLLNQLN